jgi:hypothetical protein
MANKPDSDKSPEPTSKKDSIKDPIKEAPKVAKEETKAPVDEKAPEEVKAPETPEEEKAPEVKKETPKKKATYEQLLSGVEKQIADLKESIACAPSVEIRESYEDKLRIFNSLLFPAE